MALRLVGRDLESISLGDNDWIKVKKELSKRDFLRIMETVPADKMEEDEGKVRFSIAQAIDFQKMLFDILVEEWSLDVEPTVENYLDLNREGADAIDKALTEHFQMLVPSKEEQGKPSTSRGSRRKA